MEPLTLSPEAVFRYFGEISRIPHGSGNTAALGDYCMKFAAAKGLPSYRDAAGNVMIFKEGSPGYEFSEPVILQGHLDMICEKLDTCPLDMTREGVRLIVDGEYIRADGTTLGADDGIAIAYILAVLESDCIAHPPIEALLTVDEEIGMIGAKQLDASLLKGKRLINIDSEEEGVLTASCAGGTRVTCTIPVHWIPCNDMDFCRISVNGLQGGHSGIDIAKERQNGIQLLGQLLEYIRRRCDINIGAFTGGGKENVIPGSACADIALHKHSRHLAEEAVAAFAEQAHIHLHHVEPALHISIENCEKFERCTDGNSTRTIVSVLAHIPNGVQAMSPTIPDIVQTSMNVGVAALDDRFFTLKHLIRSNTDAGKQEAMEQLTCFIKQWNGHAEFAADYPAWEYRAVSPLRDSMVKSYEELYAVRPNIQSIHAGLECGILAAKIAGLDMISFGPDLENVHTPQERMSIASAKRCWEYLLRVLSHLK